MSLQNEKGAILEKISEFLSQSTKTGKEPIIKIVLGSECIGSYSFGVIGEPAKELLELAISRIGQP